MSVFDNYFTLLAILQVLPHLALVRPYALFVNVIVNVLVSVEFKVTLHEQVRYRGTLQY